MPALAADWCAGDSSSMTDAFTESKPSKKNLYSLNGAGGSSTSDGRVLNGVRKINGNGPHRVADDIPCPKVHLFDPKKLQLHWPKRLPAGAGLSNLGNTCFLNSVLQCLVYTPPLALHLVSNEHKMTCKVKEFCMLCSLQDHLHKSLRGNGAFKPLQILQNLRNIAKSLTWGQQEDAHEFLRYVVDAMQRSCLAGTNGLDKFSKETTFVYQVFSGYLRSQVKCLKCLHASNTYDPFLDLSLDIKDSHSLEQAMASFVCPEKLDIENAYKCEKCKVKVPAQKRFTIHRKSNVLTIHLKRFDMSRPLGCKVSRHIKFPDELNLRPYMSSTQGEPIVYVLYGVLVHSGFSCNSGHYYCYVRAPNDKWYCMNDSSVTMVSTNTVFGAEAYILFYVRTGRSSNHPGAKPHTIMRAENGSGDHKAARIIGPQLPQTSHASRPSSGPRPPLAALNKSIATSSAVKFTGVKVKNHSHVKVYGTNGTPKVAIPSLVPYTERGDSDEDDYGATDTPKAEEKKTNGVGSISSQSSHPSPSLTFTPRSVLKTPSLLDSKKLHLNGNKNVDKPNGHAPKSPIAGDLSPVLPKHEQVINGDRAAQTSKTQIFNNSFVPLPDAGEMDRRACVNDVSGVLKASTNLNKCSQLTGDTQLSSTVCSSNISNKLETLSKNSGHSTSSNQPRPSRSPSLHSPETHISQNNPSDNALKSQPKLVERSPSQPSYKPRHMRTPQVHRSSPRQPRRSQSSDRYSSCPRGHKQSASRSQRLSRSRSRSPQQSRYSRSRSPFTGRSSRSSYKSRWPRLKSSCWPRRSQSPRRSRHSRSPRRSRHSRSPRRSRHSRSPRRSRHSRSPRRSRHSRSPRRSRHSRSPRRSRHSRSPCRSRHSRSPCRSRHSRSPGRSRHSRSPRRSRHSRSSHRSRHSRSPYPSRRSRTPRLSRHSGSLHVVRSPDSLRKSPSVHISRQGRSHRSKRSLSRHRSRHSRSKCKRRSSSHQSKQNINHLNSTSSHATKALQLASPCRSCIDSVTEMVNGTQLKHKEVQLRTSIGNEALAEKLSRGAKSLDEIQTNSKGYESRHTLSNDHSYSSKHTHSNGDNRNQISHELQLGNKTANPTKRKHKQRQHHKDEMEEPLLAGSTVDCDRVEVTKDNECFKEGDKLNGETDLGSRKESSICKKLSGLVHLMHSRKT